MEAETAVYLLGSSDLFGSLSIEERAAIAVRMRHEEYRPEQVIFSRGDPGREIYLVLEGRVRLSMLSSDGRELSFVDAETGAIFGELSAIDGRERTMRATAMTRVRVLALPQRALLEAMAENPKVGMAAIRFLCLRLRNADQHQTRLFEEVQARAREHAEALNWQTATAEVLQVISSSPTQVEPVFTSILQRAVSLCDALFGVIYRFDGELMHFVAHHNFTRDAQELLRAIYPSRPKKSISSRAILERTVVQAEDATSEAEMATARLLNYRGIISVPMLRDGAPIGTITLAKEQRGLFTDKQVALLQTFSDQAVIAIENTRLFEAEQASKRELQVSLEYQTATSDVLGIISRSPNELQPVFTGIVATAQRLCEAYDAAIVLRDGEQLKLKAHVGPIPMRAEWPLGNRGLVASRSVMDRTTIHVHDLMAAEAEFPEGREDALKLGHRSILAVPLVHKVEGIGTLIVRRFEVRPFTDRQIALLTTFADQAVIAIENTRLFEAEQASKRELQESLEYQTATSAVLNVISRSTRDVQPVFDAIVRSAAELFDPCTATITIREGNQILWRASAAARNADRVEKMGRMAFPVPFNPERSPSARAMLERRIVEIPDVSVLERNAAIPAAREFTRTLQAAGVRSIAFVPLLNTDEGIGTIILGHPESGFRLSEKQRALVQTFADQAVIAIENARLFEAEQASKRELQESLEQQTATADVLKVISRSALDLQKVLDALVESATRLCNAYDAVILQVAGNGILRIVAHHGPIPTGHAMALTRRAVSGRAVLDRRPIQVPDLLAVADEFPESRKRALQTGSRTALAVPLVHADEAIGAILIRRSEVRPFTERQIELVNTFADQAVIAIENTRLLEEVQARTRELAKTVEDLEIASQHKNQFVANMSHELRTPLAAILGYAELIQEGFYEPQGPKSLDALTRIRSNGKHLLGLINTVLDIAKIESGQFTLNMNEYAIESVVETVRAATESLAQNKKLLLKTDVAKSLPIGLGDEQRLTQVLLNLVGNAIKFTDTGEVRVIAQTINNHFNVTVADTGPGIPEEHQTRIFEQFHQVDSSHTKAKGGTGLGLAIAKQIVEMHGGRIWVESTLGKGSTFQMELPTRAEMRKRPS
jgi:signal transduction histidine kinase/CRP-like cAMP-binding protein